MPLTRLHNADKPTPSQSKLSDPLWRLSNLYYIKDEHAKLIKFKPNPEQEVIIRDIYIHKKRKIVILKARQLGMSTVISIIILDTLVFSRGAPCAIVDLTQTDATKKLEGKIKLAWNNLPRELTEAYEIGKDSDKRFQIKLIDQSRTKDEGWSDVQAGMNARGDTFAFLHISEWGAIQFEDEQRSVEIVTGALPAAKSGVVVVETTWKGPKDGPLWEIVDRSLKTKPEDLTTEDYTLHFFPWFTDKSYTLEGNADQIDDDTTVYLDKIEQELDMEFTPGQRLWYFKKAMSLGFYRFREYPSTLEECFRGEIQGAIYQQAVMKARTENRVTRCHYDPTNFVHTIWDLGSPVNTVTWFFQMIGNSFVFIDIMCEEDIPLTERAAAMLAKGYNYGRHILPHDAMSKEKSGKNFAEQLVALQLPNITILPRPDDIWPGINRAISMFPRFYFDDQNCERGIEGLENYRTKKDKKNNYITETPVHDWTSHIADPIRMLAEADEQGVFSRQDQNVRIASRRRGRGRRSRALSNYI